MKTDEFHTLANEIRILAGLVTKMTRRDLQQRIDVWDAGVSGLQHRIMRLLKYHEHTISELSCKLLLDPSTLVPAVDVLERKGLARRGKDPYDRRRNPLSLTERGADFIERVPAVDDQDSLVKGLDAIDDEGRQQLLVLLRELVRHMSEGEEVLRQVSSRVQPQPVAEASLATEPE